MYPCDKRGQGRGRFVWSNSLLTIVLLKGSVRFFFTLEKGGSSITAEDNSNKENPAGILTVYPLWLA